MSAPPVHDFRIEREFPIDLQARNYLALVDVETYPTHIGLKADRFDLLQHLCAETQALTAMMWEVPEGQLRLHLIWTPDDDRIDAMQRSGRQSMANGTVRTSGQLCLMDDQQLAAAARHAGPNPFLNDRSDTHFFLVPPGIYGIAIYSDRKLSHELQGDTPLGYTAFLTHHPHPAPRLHPRRFGASLLPENFSENRNVITSHRRIY